MRIFIFNLWSYEISLFALNMENRADSDISDFEEIWDEEDVEIPWKDKDQSCYICNGYYGPSFEDPVCGTCHAFLFPDLGNQHRIDIISEKTDDEDSGNDEPTDMVMDSRLRRNREVLPEFLNLPPWHQEESDNVLPLPEQLYAANVEAEFELPESPIELVPPPRPSDIEQRIEMLSNPRVPDEKSGMIIKQLPPEVLLAIFSYLDDLSLCSAASVCTYWHHLLQTHISYTTWQKFTTARWPLFKPLVHQKDWFKTYSALMDSCFCRMCLTQMSRKSVPTGDHNTWRQKRLRSELNTIRSDPPEGIKAVPLDAQCFHWQAVISGPVDSPYEGGLFYLYLQMPLTYPIDPPRVRFLTKIIHPNISRHGDVGIDSIEHNWSLALTISKVLISIQSLLTDPFTAVCMEPLLGKLYQEDRPKFDQLARQWTWKYAMNDVSIHN